MKESIRTTYTMQIAIVFILLFVGFLAVYLSFNKAFKVKNEVVNYVEKYQGLTAESNSDIGTVNLIENYMMANGHTDVGSCPDGYDGLIDGTLVSSEDTGNNKYRACFKRNHIKTVGTSSYYYYEVIVFFGFDLPVIGDLFTFSVNGETVDIQEYN